MEPTKQPLGIRILIGIGMFFVVAIIAYLVRTAIHEYMPQPATEHKGFVVSRENFTTNCIEGAQAEDLSGLNPDFASNYCGCVYDTGLEQWGGEEMTRKALALEETNDFAEWNEIVNACAASSR